jgi:hypothetical protein
MKPTGIITTLAVLAMPAPILAAIGGRCSGTYNDGQCICLTRSSCSSYGGFSFEGSPGNYPCPNDASNVWGCYVDNCPGIAGSSDACRWRDYCGNTGGTVLTSKPVFFYYHFILASETPSAERDMKSSFFKANMLMCVSQTRSAPEGTISCAARTRLRLVWPHSGELGVGSMVDGGEAISRSWEDLLQLFGHRPSVGIQHTTRDCVF